MDCRRTVSLCVVCHYPLYIIASLRCIITRTGGVRHGSMCPDLARLGWERSWRPSGRVNHRPCLFGKRKGLVKRKIVEDPSTDPRAILLLQPRQGIPTEVYTEFCHRFSGSPCTNLRSQRRAQHPSQGAGPGIGQMLPVGRALGRCSDRPQRACGIPWEGRSTPPALQQLSPSSRRCSASGEDALGQGERALPSA